MITPAVLISASGTLILSTSNRLGRAVDRVRALTERFSTLMHLEESDSQNLMLSEERALIFQQLPRLTSRVRLLQQALTAFYLAVGLFVVTSVAIGAEGLAGVKASILPIVSGLIGAAFLCYGSLVLILEARLALSNTYREMDFLWELGQRHATPELRASLERRPLHPPERER
ncbi:hypothetical protein HNR42_002699 [Deinobacterium chartae]|uniref:DUF2721 domain-containing protein n=1 Tax=Deinobacterium chartae TaxID=521158 RepID=A0A841I0F0_9DEIO|nr:DUF2721 domain-containing protein [Deinobacterium chartae]MBB6099261.1 hypothetical protein [Deinobacterium chartae]